MPPQTRRVKTLKENISVPVKTKVKINIKVNRKPLADKTNSASDDNTSNLSSTKINKKDNQNSSEAIIIKERSRRTRRLPTRYEENNVLKNLSNFNSLSPSKAESPSTQIITPVKKDSALLSPHKTPLRVSNSPLATKRSKRLCRLPSKFDGKTVSPTTNPSILPSNASTPILNKVKKPVKQNVLPNIKSKDKHHNVKTHRNNKKNNEKVPIKRTPTKITPFDVNDMSSSKELDKSEKKEKKEMEQISVTGPKKATFKNDTIDKTVSKIDTRNNSSIRLLDDKKKSLKRDSKKLDVYEFTFDPNEEPPPKKKKKKKTVKNPSKPKKVVKSRYEKNLERALAALKNTVSSKNKIQLAEEEKVENVNPIMKNNSYLPTSKPLLHSNVSEISENRYNSIRVEDIAMQFQDDNDDHSIDYSPVNSPNKALDSNEHVQETTEKFAEPVLSSTMHSNSGSALKSFNKKDPLNLQGDLSFFDEPIASSSMNVSARHPTASPWRVEFNNLPIKWQVNSYVKSNMTPAIERSFINYNDKQKKHVYTNLLASDLNEALQKIVENPQPHIPNLKQTSIISFIKEVAEKTANKKNKNKIIKSNSLFDDNTHSESISSKKNICLPETIVERSNTSAVDMQYETDNSRQDKSETSVESKNNENVTEKVADKDITYFGFDDSENQENVSPVKMKIRNKKKQSKTRSRRALQDVNKVDPSKNILMPVAVISKPVRIPNQVNKLLVEAKTATEPPVFPEQNNNKNMEETNASTDLTQTNIEDDDDSNSVHLFEDIELVHHLKPTRKSYGKPKKVTFQQSTVLNNQDSDIENQGSSDVDDLDDLSFKLPSMKEKKITKKKNKKKQRSKKEEKEVEEWAAGFNSMCEDIEEFDLVVE